MWKCSSAWLMPVASWLSGCTITITIDLIQHWPIARRQSSQSCAVVETKTRKIALGSGHDFVGIAQTTRDPAAIGREDALGNL